MNSATYKNVLRLLELWPVDLSKAGRDAGEFIRKQVGQYFIVNNVRNVDERVWDEITQRLNRISSDYYKRKFGTSRVATSTGLTESQCHEAISNDFLEHMKEESESMSKTFMGKVNKAIKG